MSLPLTSPALTRTLHPLSHRVAHPYFPRSVCSLFLFFSLSIARELKPLAHSGSPSANIYTCMYIINIHSNQKARVHASTYIYYEDDTKVIRFTLTLLSTLWVHPLEQLSSGFLHCANVRLDPFD